MKKFNAILLVCGLLLTLTNCTKEDEFNLRSVEEPIPEVLFGTWVHECQVESGIAQFVFDFEAFTEAEGIAEYRVESSTAKDQCMRVKTIYEANFSVTDNMLEIFVNKWGTQLWDETGTKIQWYFPGDPEFENFGNGDGTQLYNYAWKIVGDDLLIGVDKDENGSYEDNEYLTYVKRF